MSYPVKAGVVFILLEGDSDIKLYRKLFNEKSTKIFSLPGGKNSLERGLAELFEKFPLVIGIRDADFFHLEKKSAMVANLFLTDHHDMEMVMVASDDTFGSVAFEYFDHNSEKHVDLRSQLLSATSFVGYLRWFNELNDAAFIFMNFPFGEFYNHKSMEFDEVGFIHMLLKRSPDAKIKDVAYILEQVNCLREIDHELFQLCNGHDFIKVMALQTKNNARKGVDHEQISSAFRMAFSIQHFRNTKLFLDTSTWAASQSVTIYRS